MPMPPLTRSRHTPIDRRGTVGLVVLLCLALVAAGALVFGTALPGLADRDPFSAETLYVDPASAAAAADDAAAERIAAVPAAIWLLPEEHPVDEVAAFVAGVTADAADDDALPVFVVYGLPDRDCGNQSAGGLSASTYPGWVAEIATGLGAARSVVILEPDSLALAGDCGTLDGRFSALGAAIDRLDDSGAVVYLDGGHSAWRPAAEMAGLLDDAGVDRVRGFATNVSNYNATSAEIAYAEQVSALTGGAHYVIDTSRNGNGAAAGNEWCNPAGRAVGSSPAATRDGRHDADLWIKTPGESDGECNGGPVAGVWWPAGAAALLGG
jgi:endoglucanase